jgi:multicomponent Na+:H+ antiporter subunit F
MEGFFLAISILLTAIILIPVYRVVKGPTVFDRLVGVNAIATKTIVLICLIGFVFGRIEMFIDITLAYAILGFVGSIAISKYMSTEKGEF